MTFFCHESGVMNVTNRTPGGSTQLGVSLSTRSGVFSLRNDFLPDCINEVCNEELFGCGPPPNPQGSVHIAEPFPSCLSEFRIRNVIYRFAPFPKRPNVWPRRAMLIRHLLRCSCGCAR